MRKKNSYKTVPIQGVEADNLLAAIDGDVVVAIDVAKEAMVVGFADSTGRTSTLVRFSHPVETRLFTELIVKLQKAGRKVEVAMEPTGVYGDSIRHQLKLRAIDVFRVDPKRCHDASMLLDGVMSQHDAKACTLIAHLHAQCLSTPWRDRSEDEMRARTLLDEHAIHSGPLDRLYGRIEAITAAHWPELNAIIDQRTSWYLHLLAEYPSPDDVSRSLSQVLALLRKKTHGRATNTRIAETVSGAGETLGAPMPPERRILLQVIVRRVLLLRAEIDGVEKRLREFCGESRSLTRMSDAIGPLAAAAIFADLGDPAGYNSAEGLEKAAGLNLREKSSGTQKGRMYITKRGPGRVRRYLYLAALRLILESPIVRAWFERRKSYAPGTKHKALVAVMRKLLRSMVHVARGAVFDPSKLFDVADLKTNSAHRANEDVTALAPRNVASSPCS